MDKRFLYWTIGILLAAVGLLYLGYQDYLRQQTIIMRTVDTGANDGASLPVVPEQFEHV